MNNFVTPFCICGAHDAGTIDELKIKGWKFDIGEAGDDLCPNYPKCCPVAKEKIEF